MQVAFLDLKRMRVHKETGLEDVGPAACLSGRLQLLRGQFGASSQVQLVAFFHCCHRLFGGVLLLASLLQLLT